MSRSTRPNSPIRAELARIGHEQKSLEPQRENLQAAVDVLKDTHGWERQLPGCGQVRFWDGHLVVGQLFPQMVSSLVPLLRAQGLAAGTDFMVSDDRSSKAAAGARQVTIAKHIFKQKPELSEELLQAAKASTGEERGR